MKRSVSIVLCILMIMCFFETAMAGFWSTKKISDSELRGRLWSLENSMERSVLDEPYLSKFDSYEDAIVCLYEYIEEDGGSYSKASDAWIYLSCLLDGLDREIRWLNEEYNRVHSD